MKVGSTEAAKILSACKINVFEDFHALPSSKVECLVEHANKVKYKKPKNANGSLARYFHAYLLKSLKKDEG